MSKKYKVSIIEFSGEGESLKAQGLYEQTVESLDIRKVIEAVNAGRAARNQPDPHQPAQACSSQRPWQET